jgi:hypothetical protein
MQVDGAAPGASTIHRRRWLSVVLAIAAIVVIAAVVALVLWVVPLATSGGAAEDAIPKAGAGSAVVPHMENMQPEAAAIVRPGPHHPAGHTQPEAAPVIRPGPHHPQ